MNQNDAFVRSPDKVMVILFAFMILVGCIARNAPAQQIDFAADIYPILESNCLHCHGEDEQEAGLRLDRRAYMLRGGDSGLAAAVPDHPEQSFLVDAINHVDEEMAMPPEEDKLPEQEIELLTRWIKQGARWPGQMDEVIDEEVDHWAFQPRQTDFEHNSIDSFLHEKLAGAGLEFSAAADPRSLIRRVSIVLTGLAPTPERTGDFITAFGADADQAYEKLVDELLSSKHFGERWAQHWLDVIRWAETNGSESNLYRKNAWTYRDYVVRALNEDKSYDQFVTEQLAGDILGHGDATGFLVAGPHVPAATVGQEPTAIRQARADRIDEVLQTVGASVMGVTIGCARCHNHKFDPISIQDYYSMSAVFQDVEFGSRYPELGDDHPRKVRDKQLRAELEQLRGQLRSKGWGWVEDWTGYQDVHFPPQTVNELRMAFNGRRTMIDELEIFETTGARRNVLSREFDPVIKDNPITHKKNQPPKNLNNGLFGTKGWVGLSPKGSKEEPWLEFAFPETVTVGMIRISSNREDFFETDYLLGINKPAYGDFEIQNRGAEREWLTIASTAEMKNRGKEDVQRHATQNRIQQIIESLQIEGPQPGFVASLVEPVETFVLARGSPESPRQQVFASAPKSLGRELRLPPNSPGPQRRKAMADWLVDPANPLTARVAANRIWHHVFGTGIVTTPSDFGRAGAMPTHPELLDWLAGQFVDSDWSIKDLIRMLVMSKAFRQSSTPNDQGLATDASAQLLWRFPPRRVEAEVLRDGLLQASGGLDRSIGGPSYRIHNVKKRYAQWEVVDNHSDQTFRRMLYQERMRRVDDRMFTAFDFPDCGQVRAKRPVSTTPLQALNLMNSDFVVTQSKMLAARVKSETNDSIADQVTRCFELLLSRSPSDDELNASVEFASSQSLELLCRTLINTNEFAFLP